MSKEIYVPTEEKLYQMQDMGANVYKYLLVKAIETLALDGVKYPPKGMLKIAYKYLRNNPEIAYAICRMYPEEIKYSQIASYDINLALDLIDREEDSTLYKLDNLIHFSNCVQNNSVIGEKTILLLKNKLPISPQYRFEYKDIEFIGHDEKNHPILIYNRLLNDIFGCRYGIPGAEKRAVIEDLITIEPAYALRYEEQLGTDAVGLLRAGVNDYAKRYGISSDVGYQYQGKDILTNPSITEEKNVVSVKQLVRCINNDDKEKKIRL